MNRWMLVHVTPDFLIDMLKDGLHSYRVVEGGLPADARIIRAAFDPMVNAYCFVVESTSFPEVQEGETIPRYGPITMRKA